MAYAVKEIYYTIQGEGAQAGRGAVFLRFAGCNLWSGREEDRAGAACNFCDTNFVGTDGPGGGKFESADELAQAVREKWPVTFDMSPQASRSAARFDSSPLVVCTGGEPLLQLDAELIVALHEIGYVIAVETNGTLPAPAGIDWLCVSPKTSADLAVTVGDELKLVYPQPDLDPASYLHLNFRYFYLQPLDDVHAAANLQRTVDYCLAHPPWRLSLQTHKLLGLP